MRFVRIAQVEFSRPATERRDFSFDVDGVDVQVRPRNPDETESRHFIVLAQVPLDTTPDVGSDGKIIISDTVAREAEKAIEYVADLLAITTFSARKITAAVPTAGFSDLTAQDRQWIARSSGLSQKPSRLGFSPAPIGITGRMLSYLDDRRDGIALLAEALASGHETARLREFIRFFERAFLMAPAGFAGPLSEFLSYYNVLQYTRPEVEDWAALRNRASHADHPRRYALSRDARPVLMRIELAAHDVLFNKLHWSTRDPGRRNTWNPSGGTLPDGINMVVRIDSEIKLHAKELFDGFGAYPYDRTCKINSHPPDWWLDPSFPVKGEASIETIASLRR